MYDCYANYVLTYGHFNDNDDDDDEKYVCTHSIIPHVKSYNENTIMM